MKPIAFKRTEVRVALAGLGIAALVVTLLTALSRAPHQGDRVRRLTAQSAAIRALETLPPLPPHLAGPCRQPLAAAMTEVGARLEARAAAAGLAVGQLAFGPPLGRLPTDLVGARLDLTATGGEPALAAFLSAAASEDFPLFIDQATVTRQGGARLQIVVVARLLCRRI